MSWAKLDDAFPDNPKVLAAGPLAGWLYVCGLAYCARYLTDGHIPAGAVRRLADLDDPLGAVGRLVDVGLWEATEGGYTVHDYLTYNPSRETVERSRQEKAEAGRKGGLSTRSSSRYSTTEAPAQAVAKQSPVPVPVPVPEPGPFPAAAAAACEDEPADDGSLTLAIRAWERATGQTITAMVADMLQEAIGDYTLETLIEAIEETGRSGGKAWKYTAAVLQNWQRNGKRNGNALRGEYGVFRAVNPEPDVGDQPPAFVDQGQTLARNRAWRQVVSKLELDATERLRFALRGSAWVGMEGDMAIVETQRESASAVEALDEVSGLIAVWLRDACPDTEICDVVVRMPARGGVA